jgi:signal transduction histidine kinase
LSYQLASTLRQLQLIKELQNYNQDLEGTLESSQNNMREMRSRQNTMIIDIAHNLQTPLTILRGEIDSLRRAQGKLSSSDLSEFDQSVDRFSQFVTRLLQSADIRESQPVFGLVNLSEVVQDTLEYLQVVAEAKGVELGSDVEPGLKVRGDVKLLEEVLVNLVSNAFKYGRNGIQHRVKVQLHTKGSEVILQVSDNGIGIEDKHLPHLYERWYQVDTQQQGSGLGLAIVKKIVEDHSAELYIETQVGEGTTVSIIFQKENKKS